MLLVPLREATGLALAAGAVPFEVIAGTPFARYGARITFRAGGDPAGLATTLGLAEHPWGLPTWIGLRARLDGAVHVKAYHPPERLDRQRFALPAGLPEGLAPVMAALDGDSAELYLRLLPHQSWTSFVAAALAPLGGAADVPAFSPHPKPADGGFCLSVRWVGGAPAAVSLYADQRSLPGDAAVRRAWAEGMDETERGAYEAALAGVRSLGDVGATRARHGMLAWTRERGGGWHRAASLRVAPE